MATCRTAMTPIKPMQPGAADRQDSWAGLGRALLLAVLASCHAADPVPSPSQSRSPEPWISITAGSLIRAQHVYRTEGDIAVRCDLPEPDPFAERDAREEQLTEEFLASWKGPSEVEFEPTGFIKTPWTVPVSRLFLHPAPSGEHALLLASRDLLLERPDILGELPPLEGAVYLAPARWHADGTTAAVGGTPRRRPQGPPNEIILINSAEGRIIRRIPLGADWYIQDLAWSPDGLSLAVLAGRYRQDTGLSKWISDVVYGGSHGMSILDYRLELHTLDGSAPRLIPIAEEVEEPSRERVVWLEAPQPGQ